MPRPAGPPRKSVSVRTVFRTFPVLPLPVGAGRQESLLLLADYGDSERVPNPLRIDVVILGRLVSHLPEFLQVHLLGDLQPQAGLRKPMAANAGRIFRLKEDSISRLSAFTTAP